MIPSNVSVEGARPLSFAREVSTSFSPPCDRRGLTTLILAASAYFYVFPYFPRINNPNENVRFYATAAIVEYGTYQIDKLRARWGWVNDAAFFGGHYYSVKAPGTTLFGVPGYALYYATTRAFGLTFDRAWALWACRLTGTILPTLLWLFFVYRWLGKQAWAPILRDATFLSISVGSLLYAYGLLFVSHTLSAAAAFGSFMILFDLRRSPDLNAKGSFGHRLQPLLAGLLAASVTLFEYPGLVASVVLSVYAVFALREPRKLVFYGLGAIIPSLLVMHFHWSAFGNPFTPGHRFLENAAYRSLAREGFFGATSFSKEAAAGLLFSPSYGLFPLTPFLAVAFLGFPRLFRLKVFRLEGFVALGICLSTCCVICLMNNWRGGWTVGPRYLALIVPFVGWAALFGAERWMDRWPRMIAATALGMSCAGIVASGLPSAYYPHIPPEIDRPLPELIWVLVREGYVPHNLGTLLGLHGSASMIPFYLILLAIPVRSVGCNFPHIRDRALVLFGVLAVAVLCIAPLCVGGSHTPAISEAVSFICKTWSPH